MGGALCAQGTVKEKDLEVWRTGRLGHMVRSLLCPGQDSGDVVKTRQGTRPLWAGYDVIRIILLDLPGPWHEFEWQNERWGDGWEASVVYKR